MIGGVNMNNIEKGNILAEINKGCKRPLGNWFILFGKFVFVPFTILVIILGVLLGGIG